jgi:hypothetical protein
LLAEYGFKGGGFMEIDTGMEIDTEIDGYAETTLGDLIAALTDEASLVVRNKDEVNILAAYMIFDIFSSSDKVSRWH